MANEKTPVVWDDTTKKHRPLGTGEKMGGLDASSLLSSDSGNLLEAGSDGLAYLSGSGVVDPRADNLLEESDRGKLQVTIDRITEWLDGHPQDASLLADAISVVSGDEGNLIVQGSDNGAFLSNAELAAAFAGLSDAEKQAIAAVVAEKMAAQLADGTTIVASNGKLTSDPTNATAAQKKAINEALADEDSGLVVDPATGKLTVDFSNMPTDKFEELLKGLKMQVPLDRNITHIVATADANAGDDVVDGRGTEEKPWKTIQACVTYVTNMYSLNTHVIYIRVKSGTYTESLNLPQFDATSGFIRIESYSGSRDVVINAPVASDGLTGNCVDASGASRWQLSNLTLRLVAVPGAVPSGGATRWLLASSDNARVDLRGIKFELRKQAGSFTGGDTYSVRVVSAGTGGSVWFLPSAAAFGFETVSSAADSMACAVLAAQRDGTIYFSRSHAATNEYDVPCTGSCTTFANVFDGGAIKPFSTGSKFTFSGAGVTGKRYEVSTGSYINGAGSQTYFPGTDDGTVEAATYCWYK